MAIQIHLLGRPRIERDGALAEPPKGRKAWALLAYLVCGGGGVSRQLLASLLFADADDPLAALRWNLVELRRALGMPDALKGDTIRLTLPPGTYVDVLALERGTWAEAISAPGLGRELLEGIDIGSSGGFEAWLLNQRRHVTAGTEAVLREAALAQLGSGNVAAAADLATRLLSLNPLEESHHALLIRSYASGGDRVAAAEALAACRELFLRELGVEPGEAVATAIDVGRASSTMGPLGGPAAARAQLEAGEAAITAGVFDAGIQCLRRAIAEAHACGDVPLKSRALFALGSALAHSGVKAKHEEAAAALHEVIALCATTGDQAISASGHRELAWIEFLQARYGRAQLMLRTAIEQAGDDTRERAAALGNLGICLTEVGRYAESLDALHGAIELAEGAGDARRLGFVLAWLGRAHLLRQEWDPARGALERSLDLVRGEGWTWFIPLPETYLGELEVLEGRLDVAGEILGHAFAMASEIGDPCYQCMSGRGLGLLEAARGNVGGAIERLDDSRMRLVRAPDYTWGMASALEGLCEVAAAHRDPRAPEWITDLESVAGRTGMRELLARAYVHRATLGDRSAAAAAHVIASEIDNPALHELIVAAA